MSFLSDLAKTAQSAEQKSKQENDKLKEFEDRIVNCEQRAAKEAVHTIKRQIERNVEQKGSDAFQGYCKPEIIYRDKGVYLYFTWASLNKVGYHNEKSNGHFHTLFEKNGIYASMESGDSYDYQMYCKIADYSNNFFGSMDSITLKPLNPRGQSIIDMIISQLAEEGISASLVILKKGREVNHSRTVLGGESGLYIKYGVSL